MLLCEVWNSVAADPLVAGHGVSFHAVFDAATAAAGLSMRDPVIQASDRNAPQSLPSGEQAVAMETPAQECFHLDGIADDSDDTISVCSDSVSDPTDAPTESNNDVDNNQNNDPPRPIAIPPAHSSPARLLSCFTLSASSWLTGLGMLGSIPLLSSSPAGRSATRSVPGAHTLPLLSAPRARLVARAAALLDASSAVGGNSADSYEELLALDHFAVRRVVRRVVLNNLPTRVPDAADAAARCDICLQPWVTAAGSCLGGGRSQTARPTPGHERCGSGSSDERGCPTEEGSSSSSSRRAAKCDTLQLLLSATAPVHIAQLPCGHEFCAACVRRWLSLAATCPTCRYVFPDDLTFLTNLH